MKESQPISLIYLTKSFLRIKMHLTKSKFLSFVDYPGNSGDSFCSSDVSLDGSSFDHLDEGTSDTLSLQNLDLQTGHGQSGGHESLVSLTAGVINPIDKLYLMQNSYFSSDQ